MKSSLTQTFEKAANPPKKQPKRKRPAPLSLRLSQEERSLLERRAGNKPLGTYIRGQLFGKEAIKNSPVRRQRIDYQLLGKLLAALGESDIASCLCILAAQAENGSLEVDEQIAGQLSTACADVRAMRLILISALGLKPEKKP